MILATLDGLAYQVALDPDAVDVNAVFELLYDFVADALQRGSERARPCSRPHRHGEYGPTT